MMAASQDTVQAPGRGSLAPCREMIRGETGLSGGLGQLTEAGVPNSAYPPSFRAGE